MARPASLAERTLVQFIRDGRWEIDENGRIWRTWRRTGLKAGGSHWIPVARRRVERRTPAGYLQVSAEIDGKRLHCGAHRLVWQWCRGDIPVGHEINHRNGLKDDNRPSNLLCGPPGANVEHAHRGGLIDQHGQRNPAAKLTDNQVAQIRLAYDQGGHTMEGLAKRFRITFQHVSKIVRGQRRPKQGGPTADRDRRYNACERDPQTGRFTGRRLGGREHNGMPEPAR